MRVYVAVTLEEEHSYGGEGEEGNPGLIRARCSRCGHEVEAYGNSGRSVRYCLATLREECPKGEHNFCVRHEPTSDELLDDED